MAVRDEDFGTALTPAEGDDWIGSPPEAVPACEPCDWRSLFERERTRAERERARADAAQGRCEELRWAEVQARSDGGTAYPLSAVVGEALLDYLKHARPTTPQRQIFFNVLAPRVPMGWNAIANRAAHYLHKAGIRVRRPGSHTLRHTCVQRLIDAQFPLKTIGDYVGHRRTSSTEIYTKVANAAVRIMPSRRPEPLQELAVGRGMSA